MQHIILVGLGNPGLNYENTRHNIGFNLIDAIAEKFDFPSFSNKFASLVSSKLILNKKITLLKPQTYMNLSGEAVAKVSSFYKIDLSNIIVIHDDIDLSFAKIKMKIAGGSGGHNGIKSIDQHLSSNYYRLRIGVGKPNSMRNVGDYVLDKFTKEEEKIIEKISQLIIEHLDLVLDKNMALFMNKMAMEYQTYGL
ncbi:MAG: aminoacyl-tRNA hydrolase [Rickettsiales bacterium]